MTSHHVFTLDRTISLCQRSPKCIWHESFWKYMRFRSILPTDPTGNQIAGASQITVLPSYAIYSSYLHNAERL